MKISVLYNYLAEELHTHIRIFDNNGNLTESYKIMKNLRDDFADSLKYIPCTAKFREPHLYTLNNLLSYLAVPLDKYLCVIGPVGVYEECITKYHIPELILPNEFISNLYTVSSTRLIHIGVFLYNFITDTSIDELECLNHNCTPMVVLDKALKSSSDAIFSHEEYGKTHNPYTAEQREMACIERGDLLQLRECWKENYDYNLGMLSSDDLTHAKYLSIINIALSSRAAIKGGLPYEAAYSLSDAYCQQIDALDYNGLAHIKAIVRNIQVSYTNLVAQQKGNNPEQSEDNPLVTRAKNYIFSHLHGRLTVNEVAMNLSIHPNYLSKLFKQTQNITIHEYILRQKINLVRNMLTYSNYSYIEIANYLGFSSQSHLGDKFKKFTGMTLKQYRDTYKRT